jgi:hypothetical protein
MEVEVKLRLPDAAAHQRLSDALASSHRCTHLQVSFTVFLVVRHVCDIFSKGDIKFILSYRFVVVHRYDLFYDEREQGTVSC